MSKIIGLFLLLVPSYYIFSMSKAPETPPIIIPMIQLEIYRTQSSILYYPIRPIIQNNNTNIINISPLISHTYIKGETQFQMLISFYPIENYTEPARYVTISSPRYTITLPLINKQITYLDNSLTNSNYAKNIGYVCLFPEDIANLQLLILESDQDPSYSWTYKQSKEYISTIVTENKTIKSILYQTNNLQHFYNLQRATKLKKLLILNRYLPSFTREKKVVLTLQGTTQSQQWQLTPYQLWTLIDLIKIHTELSKGVIPY